MQLNEWGNSCQKPDFGLFSPKQVIVQTIQKYSFLFSSRTGTLFFYGMLKSRNQLIAYRYFIAK